jgi:hypothetical protein
VGACSVQGVAPRQSESERKQSNEKAAKSVHVNKNRCTLIAAACLATGESDPDGGTCALHVQRARNCNSYWRAISWRAP